MTPEPQYATRSPAGSSGSGSFQGAFSAPGIRPGTRSTGFGSPRQRGSSRASTTTSCSRARRAPRGRSCRRSLARLEHRRLDRPRLRRRAGRASRRGRTPRSRRGRSGGAATRAARRRRASRTRRRRLRRRCPRATAAAANCSADGSGWRPPAPGRRGEIALDVQERGARDVAPPGRPEARSRDRPAPSGSRRSGTPSVTGNHAAAYRGHETPNSIRSARRRRRSSSRPWPGSAGPRRPAARRAPPDTVTTLGHGVDHDRARRGDGHLGRAHAGSDREGGARRRTHG